MVVLLPEKLDHCRAQMGYNYRLGYDAAHLSESLVFAGTCRRAYKANIQDPLRNDIPKTFAGMAGESRRSAGNLFPGTEEGLKNPFPLCIRTYVICNQLPLTMKEIMGSFSWPEF